MEVKTLFEMVARTYILPYENLKDEQLKVIDHLLKGDNVLAILPTGYGKSACLYLPPLLLDEVSLAPESHLCFIFFVHNK